MTAPLHDGSSPGLRRQVMSQQTQVARVVAYHKRWIARWPTVQVASPAYLHSPCRHERILCLRSASNYSSLCLVTPSPCLVMPGLRFLWGACSSH